MHEPGPFSLAGKLAVVSGGTRGIGLSIARGLGHAGADILIIGRDRAKAEESTASLAGEGLKASFLLADVTREEDCRKVGDAVANRGRPLDILVNNAGTNDRRPPENYSMEEWHFLIDANLTSVFALTRALKPLMTRGGKIINIGSMTSIFGASFSAPYGAAKGGVVQLTKALASAWARENIQVNAILPGWIETELTRRGRAATPDLQERVIARTPAGRWGQPADIAGAAVFLASPASDFITGAALPVDGGYSAQA
jgi:2-deoxy-D-gluconate 3-dehydrogenase